MFEVAALPRQDQFGAVVTGLSATSLNQPALRKALYELWIDKGVIVFRDMAGVDAQISLSEIFGEAEEHPLLKDFAWTTEHRLVIDVEYDGTTEDRDLYEVDGEVRGSWLPWHSDAVYLDEINHGGILRPIEIPERGGETGFIDKIAAYEALPDDLKQRIEGLNVLYYYNVDSSQARFGKRPDKLIHLSEKLQHVARSQVKRGRSIHPMVYTQKETGRKVLNISPWFADGIEGMENDEGDSLLTEVIDYCIRPELSYFHQWQMGDMVLWDNWRMLHCASGVPVGMRRLMRRTTIAGDYGLGRFEEQAAASATDEIRPGM